MHEDDVGLWAQAPGVHLRDVGLDVRPGRAAHAEGRLVHWWQLELDDSGGSPPAGQLVVAWRDGSETVAQLEPLESKPSVTEGAIEHLQHGLPWHPEHGTMRLHAADVP